MFTAWSLVSATSGNLLGMQMCRLHVRPIASEALERAGQCVLTCPQELLMLEWGTGCSRQAFRGLTAIPWVPTVCAKVGWGVVNTEMSSPVETIPDGPPASSARRGSQGSSVSLHPHPQCGPWCRCIPLFAGQSLLLNGRMQRSGLVLFLHP